MVKKDATETGGRQNLIIQLPTTVIQLSGPANLAWEDHSGKILMTRKCAKPLISLGLVQFNEILESGSIGPPSVADGEFHIEKEQIIPRKLAAKSPSRAIFFADGVQSTQSLIMMNRMGFGTDCGGYSLFAVPRTLRP